MTDETKKSDVRYAVVPAGGADVMTMSVDGTVIVPMRPFTEALGMNWPNEFRRINNDPILSKAVVKLTTAFSNGQESLCLPLTHFHGWLFKLNLNTVNEQARPIVEALQIEGYQVLSDYWTKGAAINPRFQQKAVPDIRAVLRLLEAIRKEPQVGVQRMLHQMLGTQCALAGAELPALENILDGTGLIGRYAATLELFWERFEYLNGLDPEKPVNLHRRPGMIAISIPDIEQRCARLRLSLPPATELRAALKLSQNPRFVEATTVNTVSGESRRCWIFERNDTAQPSLFDAAGQ